MVAAVSGNCPHSIKDTPMTAFSADTADHPIGTVELLRLRVYTIDPADDVTNLSDASAIVKPGTYPPYQDADGYWFKLTGSVNRRGVTVEPLWPGTFAMHRHGDEATSKKVTVPSRRFTAEKLAELLTVDPMFREGDPQQRLRFHFEPGSDPRDCGTTTR
jgi:hypothetical protein